MERVSCSTTFEPLIVYQERPPSQPVLLSLRFLRGHIRKIFCYHRRHEWAELRPPRRP